MNKRNIYLLVIFISLFYFINTAGDDGPNPKLTQVVNSCGDGEGIKEGNPPNDVNDCKDKNEHACKMVTVSTVNGEGKEIVEKQYCAIIHGKYNDQEVWSKVGDIVGKKIKIEGSGNFIKISYLVIVGFLIGILN